MKLLKKASLILGLGLAVLAPVQAAVTQWTYTYNSLWTGSQPPSVTFSPTQLRWGSTPGNPTESSLTIIVPTLTTFVDTYFGVGPIATFEADGSLIRHANNPIEGSSLTATQLRSTLEFTPNLPAVGPTAAPPLLVDLNINFFETFNGGVCGATSPPGNPCNDIFVLTTTSINDTFTYDGQLYAVNVFPKAGTFSTLEDSACLSVGAPIGCAGFTTPEGLTSDLRLAFTISAVNDAPEPGSLALLGLGLVGLAAVRRRQQS